MKEVYIRLDEGSQLDLVLNHLYFFKEITNMEAFERYGITRLSGRIFDLREKGVGIVTDYREKKGKSGRYGVYKLEDEQTIHTIYNDIRHTARTMVQE